MRRSKGTRPWLNPLTADSGFAAWRHAPAGPLGSVEKKRGASKAVEKKSVKDGHGNPSVGWWEENGGPCGGGKLKEKKPPFSGKAKGTTLGGTAMQLLSPEGGSLVGEKTKVVTKVQGQTEEA